MKEKNVLICLDKLDIGGVETFVFNQSMALKNKGYNITILSKDGLYRKELESKGIKWIEFDFKATNYFVYEKIEKIVNIINENEITEVHINQLPEINYMYPACLIANVPYVAYLHFQKGAIQDNNNVFDYFENQYSTYKESLKIFFKYAYKIIAITNDVKSYTIKRYNIAEEKCIVIPNSINFEEYKAIRQVEKIEKLVIVSRIDEEKEKSIINGIKLYDELKKYIKNASLKIIGDGKIRNKIEKFVQEEKIEKVEFVGATNNVKKYLEESDLVIGIDRCILEAIAMKRVAVISGYERLRKIVVSKDIEAEIAENLCGRSLQAIEKEKLAKDIADLKKEEISNIVEENYTKILEKLDVNKNIYTINQNEYFYNINQNELINDFIKLNNILGKNEEEYIKKGEKIWYDHIEYKTWIEQENKKLKQINAELEQENIKNKEKLQNIKSKCKNLEINKIKERLFGKNTKG